MSLSITPAPRMAFVRPGLFEGFRHGAVCVKCNNAGPESEAEQLRAWAIATGVRIDDIAPTIELETAADLQAEAYELDVAENRIMIRGGDAVGVFYGIQSLRQLVSFGGTEAGAQGIACCRIEDQPRFAWRGFMLDESRHFFGKAYVKRLLDWMGLFKLNRFHWHLTDEPAWRIEIKAYPRLTGIGSQGSWSDPEAPHAFYTQDDIREIVDYAAARHIVVIPEIDMPGHATAANRAYPEFSGGGSERCPEFTFDPGNEGTYAYLEDILGEVAGIFPGPWLHFGGDEVHFGNEQWNSNAGVRQLMEREGYTELKEVEFHFIRRMSSFIKELGKTSMGWDEIVGSGIPPDEAAVMWWRHDRTDVRDEAWVCGFRTVLCPRIPCYFDFVQHDSHEWGRRWQGEFGTLEGLYRYPGPGDMPEGMGELVLGIQGNLWTERVRGEARADFMTYPRLFALAEAGWAAEDAKDPDSFRERLAQILPALGRAGISYFNALCPESTPEVSGVEKASGPAMLEEEVREQSVSG